MGDRAYDDDRPTVDLGPRALETVGPAEGDGDETEAVASALDETRSMVTPKPDDKANVDPVHHLPTQQLSKRPRSSTGSLSRALTSSSSPVEAMRSDEIARMRVFLRAAFFICISGALIALVTSGDVIAKQVVGVGSVLGALGALWMLFRVRNEEQYDQMRLVGPGFLLILGAFSGVYYWGTASPVVGMIVYGIYFFGLGGSKKFTLGMYILISAIHAALGALIFAGAIEDRGMITMSGLQPFEQLAIVLIIEFLYFLAYITARISQRVTLEAMSKLEQAVRGMAQRDALLAEARAELDRALKVGGPGRFTEQVVGSFRLGILIGRGGMGEVYEAHGTSDQREAAVKLLHPGTLADPTAVARFIREAQTASKLDTPHVVRVLEVGTTAGEIPFLAMERLRGHDLAHQLRRHRRLELAQANVIAAEVGRGLEAAREAGIVHRDLKPHNIFFAEQGDERRWKILDFGVSKSGSHGTLTKGHVVGTPAYMAPEQARGEDVDHRADVYSLAAILFRTITGHPAFTGKDVPTTLYEVVYRIPSQPSLLAPVPTDIDRVLAIGLAKTITDRFSTALELADWFDRAIGSALVPEERQRADELIARQPWGTRPGLA